MVGSLRRYECYKIRAYSRGRIPHASLLQQAEEFLQGGVGGSGGGGAAAEGDARLFRGDAVLHQFAGSVVRIRNPHLRDGAVGTFAGVFRTPQGDGMSYLEIAHLRIGREAQRIKNAQRKRAAIGTFGLLPTWMACSAVL